VKVLFVTGEFPPMVGGVGDYTDRLAGALCDRGDEAVVLTSSLPTKVAVANTDAVWAGLPNAAVFYAVARWDFSAWKTVIAAIRAERPDVVHLQYQAAAFGTRGQITLLPWMLRSWNIRPLVVTTFHDLLSPHLFPLSGRVGLDRAAVGWLASASDAVIATNGEDRDRLKALRVKRLWRAPIGSNIAAPPPSEFDRQAWRRQHGLGPEQLALAYFGFYNASKGLDELFTAFAKLLRERPTDRLFLIGGGTGQTDPTNVDYERHLRQLVVDLGLTERISWVGYRDAAEISAYLIGADVVVLPFRDGVSLRRGTLMAALTHGCAIVTTRPSRPIPELEQHQAVVTYSAGEDGALLAALESCTSVETRSRLRQGALTAARQFAWPAIAATHSAMYRSLCREVT